MSAASEKLAHKLLGLYPEAWRERYRSEVGALIEDDPPGARGLASLLVGAADAHLRPPRRLRESGTAVNRMRLSIGAVFCCWIVLALNGIGFQKDTEEASFAAAGARHPLLALAHGAVLVGALLGAAAIAVGGVPLLWQALREALAGRERRLVLALLAPALAVAAFAAFTWLLVTVAPTRGAGFPVSFVLLVQAPWRVASWACAAVCALAPRVVLARIHPTPAALRRASRAAVALALAMALVTTALAIYAIALPAQAAPLAGESTAPVGASTGVMLGLYAIAAALVSVLAASAANRAVRAARSAG